MAGTPSNYPQPQQPPPQYPPPPQPPAQPMALDEGVRKVNQEIANHQGRIII